MTKLFIAVFGVMTLGAGYLTVNDVGVMEPTIQKASVRSGSSHRHGGVFFIGGFRGGK